MFYWDKISWNILFILFSLFAAASAHAQEEETSEYILPPYLLHAGDKKILMEDIRRKGISQEVWDKFIMSGTGNFDGLPDFRRGLYGVLPEDLSKISLYGSDQWCKGKENWVMIIHLKPECRKNMVENYEVIDDDATGTKDPFTLWFAGKDRRTSLSPETMQFCINNGNEKYWTVGPFFGLNAADPESKKRSKICGEAIQSFFQETKAKIVIDPMNGDYADYSSWAIRDRSCIEKITGTPEDLFQGLVLGKLNKGITSEFFGDSVKPYNRPWANLYLMINIFSEAPGFLTANWQKVFSKFMVETNMQYAEEQIKNFTDEPHLVRNAHFEAAGHYLLKYTAQCAKKKNLVELQALYKDFMNWFFARTKVCVAKDENDPVCRWGANSDLKDWKHVSSVVSLLREAKKMCALN